MSRPSLIVRVAGSPLPALLLFLGYAALVLGWYEGQVVWWLALGAVVGCLRTLSAIGQVRRYKAWLAEWNAMGAKDEPAPRPKKKNGGWVFVTLAAFLLLAIPAYLPQAHGQGFAPALVLLWGVAGLYLVFRIARSMTHRKKERPPEQEQVEATPVEWVLGRASSSPSRSEAARKLPEYSARLLGS